MGGPAAGACPGCGQPVAAEDGFCEACGRDLYPITVSVGEPGHGGPCPVCGSRVGADGYCEQCGRKAPSGSYHVELDNGMLAGITDRGLRHRRNEDAMAIAATDTSAGPAAVAVVCDGVSTSARADEAALAAVGCAARALVAALRAGLGDADGWLEDASAAAAQQLTRDDSLAEELTADGSLSASQALDSPQAHVITRWLGADAGELVPHVTTLRPTGQGVVLLCLDGLWNYRPEAADLASLALPAACADPLAAAASLVACALDAGGRDNITVVLIPVPPARRTPVTSPLKLRSAAHERA